MVVLIHISVQTLIPMAAAPARPPCPARFAALLRIAQVSIFGLSPGTGTAAISKLFETKVISTVSGHPQNCILRFSQSCSVWWLEDSWMIQDDPSSPPLHMMDVQPQPHSPIGVRKNWFANIVVTCSSQVRMHYQGEIFGISLPWETDLIDFPLGRVS